MTERELDEILRSAKAPCRPEDYWEEFPAKVMGEIRMSAARAEVGAVSAVAWWDRRESLAWAMAACAAVLVIMASLVTGLWTGTESSGSESPKLAELRKCFREIETLFPNQVQAVVLDAHGPRMLLADRPNVSAAQPVYLEIRGPEGVLWVITFSGQEVRLNGDSCEVLVGRSGRVLLMSRAWVWSGSKYMGKPGPYRIEARTLEAS